MTHGHRSSLTRMPIIGTITLMVGGLALFAASAPAVAADPLRTERVIAKASELASVHGRNAIEDRVRRAAMRVCAVDNRRNLGAVTQQRNCVVAAISMSRLQMAAILASRPMMAAAPPASNNFPSATSPEEPSVL